MLRLPSFQELPSSVECAAPSFSEMVASIGRKHDDWMHAVWISLSQGLQLVEPPPDKVEVIQLQLGHEILCSQRRAVKRLMGTNDIFLPCT